MSPDLTRALHDAVDTGPSDLPFAVDGLAARIRRRRTVRAGVRGGVAVGAAGAVALGAVHIGGRQPTSVLPAARSDAAPGTCGSDIGSLPAASTPGGIGLIPSTDGSWGADVAGVPPVGIDLGRLVGRALTPILVRPLAPEVRADLIADNVRAAQEVLVETEARRVAEATPAPGSGPVDTSRLRSLDEEVQQARAQLEQAGEGMPVFGLADDLHSVVLVTHGTTVVATDGGQEAPTEDYWWTSPVDPGVAMTLLSTDLSTCASPGDRGGVPLPGGEYSVYVAYDQADGGGRAVEGPWPVTLLEAPPALSGLPADFPDGLPLIGGRLLSVSPMSFSSGEGWGVEVAVDGDDALDEAVRLLGGDQQPAPTLSSTATGYYAVDGWEIGVVRSTSVDGDPTVFYTVRPS